MKIGTGAGNMVQSYHLAELRDGRMDIRLEQALNALAAQYELTALTRDAKTISENYRLRTGAGKRLLTREGEAAAYAASRMPATFAAAQQALSWALDCVDVEIESLLDCGAGTGAVTWAADSLLELESFTCLEREAAMRTVGGELMRAGEGALQSAVWQEWDAVSGSALPKADLVCEGYMIGELSEENRLPAAQRMYEAAGKMALFIEPGTPQGFANLAAVRKHLAGLGAYVAAPCPAGTKECPMAGEDWCHFTVRVQRTKLHKQLKGGDAPYEDEKFCFLALTKEPPKAACAARVLRHPQIGPGRIALTLCENGSVQNRVVTKKDPLWKRARKIGAGDAI